MTTEIDWDDAQEGAEFYACGHFYKHIDGVLSFREGRIWHESRYSLSERKSRKDYQDRPQPKPKYEYGVEYPTNGNKPDLPDDVVVEFRKSDGNWNSLGCDTVDSWDWKGSSAFRIVDGRYKPAEMAQVELKQQNPYQRTIIGLDGSKCVVDVYRILDAFKTDSPALDHAIKKILCPGNRHQKGREQDLREAIASIEAELLLMSQR